MDIQMRGADSTLHPKVGDLRSELSKIEDFPHQRQAKRLRRQTRHLMFHYMKNQNLAREKLMEPCVMPFLNRDHIQDLWSSESLLVVLDSGCMTNLVLPEDYDSNTISQIGLSLNLALAMIRLARPTNIHLKVNVMSDLPFADYIRLARFLKSTDWIREVRLSVPSIPSASIRMLVDLIAPKITFYHGPNAYISLLVGRAKLQTIQYTSCYRPCDWTNQTQKPLATAGFSIVDAFRTDAQKLRFEFSGLFERLWTNDPLPLNQSANTIRITDSELMNKQRFSEHLSPEIAAHCRRSMQTLCKAVHPLCDVMFNHRSWCGFPRLQSLEALISELTLLIKRARHLTQIAHGEGLNRFRAAIEMDVVLRKNSLPCGIRPELVLALLEREFGCQFAPYSGPQNKNPPNKPPQYFLTTIDEKSVIVILDFSYGIHPL